jgi:plasmid stability protein
MNKSITITLPQTLYEQIQEKAQRHHRSIEAEIVESVAISVSDEITLPTDVQAVLVGLAFMDDDDLWRAARSHLPQMAAETLQELNYKQQSEGLTPSEQETHVTLLQQYDRYMLVRAKAAALLKERGHDISILVPGL